jgi:hypothetical protein
VCTHLFAVFASMDQCGSQHALVSRVTLRNSEVVPAPMQVARAEVADAPPAAASSAKVAQLLMEAPLRRAMQVQDCLPENWARPPL